MNEIHYSGPCPETMSELLKLLNSLGASSLTIGYYAFSPGRGRSYNVIQRSAVDRELGGGVRLIFGSGIVGLLARHILGADWSIVPFGKSRFFTFTPPLDDNFLVHDGRINDLVRSLGVDTTQVAVKRVYSNGGQLYYNDNALLRAWLDKTFKGDPPPHAETYMRARATVFAYRNARLSRIYAALQERYDDDIKKGLAAGKVTEVGDHYVVRGGVKVPFEAAVSTIPLKAMAGLAGKQLNLRYSPTHFVHLESKSIDLEGADQAFVVDSALHFYKVARLAPGRYLFYFNEDVQNIGQYFMPILKDYDIIDGTMVGEYLPLGSMPDLSWLSKLGVTCVGSYAQHDWCADVGSNAMRLLGMKI